MSGRFEFSKELKDRLVHMVINKGVDPKSLVKKYDLPQVKHPAELGGYLQDFIGKRISYFALDAKK